MKVFYTLEDESNPILKRQEPEVSFIILKFSGGSHRLWLPPL